jgi:uncharacterized protein involved in propanediol utilization
MQEQVEEYKFEVKGYVVPYDLPSENVFQLRENEKETAEEKKKREELRDYVRAKRVQATYYLHQLGVLATNSVVLVPQSRAHLIDEVIEEVDKIYNEVNARLEKEGFFQIGMPIIKKIPMVQTQIVDFKDLAEKQLKEKLDKKIDDLASLIQKLQEGVEEGKARSIRYNLNSMKKEIDNLEQVAKELGIETDNQFALLAQMINQAIEILGGQ